MTAKFKKKQETFSLSPDPKNSPEAFLKKEILVTLMHKLNLAKNIDQLLSVAADYCFKLFSIDGVAVFLPDQDQTYLVPKIIQAIDKERLNKAIKLTIFQKMPLKTNYSVARAYLSQKTTVAQQTLIPAMKKIGIKTVISFPMIVNDQCLGVLSLGYGKGFTPNQEDLKTGELLASHLATSIYSFELLDSVRNQNEWLSIIQENIREGFSLFGPDDVLYYANKMVAKLFGTKGSLIGLKREEVVSQWDKLHRYSIERFFDAKLMQKTVFVDNKPFLGALMKVNSKPPKLIETNYYPVFKNNKFMGLAAAYRDVTKEKKQEQNLSEQMEIYKTEKERSEAIIENVEEGICLVSGDLRITLMNSACETISGWTIAEAIGQSYYEVFNCHTKNGLHYPDFDPLNKVIVTKEATQYEEYLHTNRSGEEFWVGVSASPLLNSENQVGEIVLVIRDISSIKEVEKAKSEFVSIASHELRTPLTVVNGYLTLLKDGDLGDFTTADSRKRLQEILEKVSSETSRLTNLVSDLLNVSRIEEKRITLTLRPQKIDKVIDKVVEAMKTTAKLKNIKLAFQQNADSDLVANFDFDKIYQVLINLVDNSMKFTPVGGSILLETWAESGKIFIQVKDNGIGIPTKLQSVIFEKFQQVPGSYLKENRGTGLGLFIVKSLVELHNGEIILESETGRGTKIAFSLPI